MADEALREGLIAAAQAHDLEAIRRILADEHAANIADILESLDDEEVGAVILSALSGEVVGDVLDEVDNSLMIELLEELPAEDSARALDAIPSDDAAEILHEMGDAAGEIIDQMEDAEAVDVLELLGHEEETAGRIMAREVIALDQFFRPDEAINYIRAVADEVETIYYLYAVDLDGKLVGVISLRELLIAPRHLKIRDFMKTDVISVRTDMDQEEVARIVAKFDLLAVPAVDAHGLLVGVVTVDDVVDVIEQEAAEDMYAFAGTSHESEFRRSPVRSALARLPWLLVCLVGGLVSGAVMHRFEGGLANFASLAIFVPVVMALGGSVGTQSLATTIQAIARDEFATLKTWRAVLKELAIGLCVGATCGGVTGLVGGHWLGDPRIGLVVFLAMMLSQGFAAVLGTALPLIFRALGRDAALASGPFITTLNDIISVTLYFGFALVLLRTL